MESIFQLMYTATIHEWKSRNNIAKPAKPGVIGASEWSCSSLDGSEVNEYTLNQVCRKYAQTGLCQN